MKNKFTVLGLMFVFAAFFVSAQETVLNPNASITVETGATLDFTAGGLVLKSDVSGGCIAD